MQILEYITSNALILVPVLYIIGLIIKATPKIRDWTIPYILLPLGILGSIWLMGFSLESVIQGILITGASVYANQLFKQAAKCNSFDKT